MDLDHMLPSQRTTQILHGEQLGNTSDAKLSTLEPQRLLDLSALNAMPSPLLHSPPHYTSHPKFPGDHAASLNRQHSPFTLGPLNEPATELAPIQCQNGKGGSESLPSLSSVTSGLPPSPEPRPTTYWPNLNPLAVYYSPGHMQAGETPPRVDPETASAPSEHYYEQRSASVSLDDPDVRMAAEALGNLRTDFVSSPPNRNTPLPATPREQSTTVSSPPDSMGEQQPEPLLSLITAYHPVLATAVGVSTSAYNVYNQGKDLSPQFKTGAEYLEGYLTPIAKAVGDVGRKAPLLESGARWMFTRKQSRKHQSGVALESSSSKRRRAQLNDEEKEVLDRSFPEAERRMSVSTIDTLPAYDDQRSPAYSEVLDGQVARPGPNGSEWKSRIVVSTSGLGVAMRAESLVKLKYCLERLRSVNSSVSETLNKLQSVVDQYDAAKERTGGEHASTGASGSSAETPDDQKQLLARMDTLKKDIASSLVSAIRLVSKYAGSALPDNVRNVVHEQFTSLPQRFMAHLAYQGPAERASNNDRETAMREGARGVLILAKDGIQMITHVSDVIDRTIRTAEEWCEVMSKDKPEGSSAPEKAPLPVQWATESPAPPASAPQASEDVQMTG